MRKRLITVLMPLILLTLLSACAPKTTIKTIPSPSATENTNVNTTDTKPTENTSTISPTPGVAKPLSVSDFMITDGKNIISLYTAFMDLKIDQKEHEVENNFVGENTVDGFIYKYFVHQYDDFDLFVSNANYNLKGKDFDDRYVSQITLKNKSDFKTLRGITIGSSLSDVVNAYGQVEIKNEEGNEFVDYQFEDMGLKFTIDTNKVVTGIIVDIIVKN